MYYNYSDNINPQPSNYDPSSAGCRLNNSGNDRNRCWCAIHARRPAAAHRLVPLAPPGPWDLRDQWDPEGAPAHLAPQDPPVPWGHRVM